MSEEETIQLYKKINEYKQAYEEAKRKRIELVSEIELLDNKISQHEASKQENEIEYNNLNIVKDEIRKRIKYMFHISILSLIILVIINTIIGSFNMFLLQTLITLAINAIGNIILPFTIIKVKNYKYKTADAKQETTLNKEYQELLEQRISKGQKYKEIWETEVLLGKIYKAIENIIVEQINENKSIYSVVNEVNIQDVYRSIVLYPSFFEEKTEEKITILDEEMRRYLAKKISECYHNKIEIDYLLTYSPPELIKILLREIPQNERNEKLRHIIHATLGFYGTVQKYSIVWYEEKEIKLIDNPELIFDEEGKFIELKTHKNTDYETLFTIVYNSFINSSKQNKCKTRTKE